MPRITDVARDELTDLQQIPNIGPAIAGDLQRIGIQRPDELTDQDPFSLYEQLCHQDEKRHDPCVLDVFMAAVDFMNGNPEQPWWKFTPKRKRKLKQRQQEEASATATRLGRRALLVNGVLSLFAAKTLQLSASEPLAVPEEFVELRFCLLTDLHYADKNPGGTRHYRETPRKLADARTAIEKFRPQFVVELGDVIDAAESVERERQYLQTIHQQLDALPGENHYVLGNHCVYWLTKPEFLEVVGQKRTFYSFNSQGYHLIVLDGCFRSDGTPYGRKNFEWTDSILSEEQINWLEADLKKTTAPTLAFIHQRLDVGGHYGVKNAPRVRQLLEDSGKVMAVFQGHYHKNDYKEINGIHYCTIAAMVEGAEQDDNAFANVTIDKQGTIHVDGYFRQKDYRWPRSGT